MNKNFKPILFVAILTLSTAVSAQVPTAPAAPAQVPVAAPVSAPAPAAMPVEAPAPVAVPEQPVVAPEPVAAPVATPVVVVPEPAPAPVAVSEEPAPAAAPASTGGMFGLAVGFNGSLAPNTIGLAYARGLWKITLDFSFERDILDDNTNGPDTQTISVAPGFFHDIGKCLLPFGLGVSGGINIKDEGSDTGNLDWWAMPAFYTKAMPINNVSLGLLVGPRIANGGTKDLHLSLVTSGRVTFYFL